MLEEDLFREGGVVGGGDGFEPFVALRSSGGHVSGQVLEGVSAWAPCSLSTYTSATKDIPKRLGLPLINRIRSFVIITSSFELLWQHTSNEMSTTKAMMVNNLANFTQSKINTAKLRQIPENIVIHFSGIITIFTVFAKVITFENVFG